MSVVSRKIRMLVVIDNMQAERKVGGSPLVILQSTLPRKVSKLNICESVPQTDTGDQVE